MKSIDEAVSKAIDECLIATYDVLKLKETQDTVVVRYSLIATYDVLKWKWKDYMTDKGLCLIATYDVLK